MGFFDPPPLRADGPRPRVLLPPDARPGCFRAVFVAAIAIWTLLLPAFALGAFALASWMLGWHPPAKAWWLVGGCAGVGGIWLGVTIGTGLVNEIIRAGVRVGDAKVVVGDERKHL